MINFLSSKEGIVRAEVVHNKGCFLKCLQILVKSGLKRSRVKGSNSQNTIYTDGEPRRIFVQGCTKISGQQRLPP